MSLTKPDRLFSRVSCIDVQADLLDCGLTHVLLDIDNTIRSRADGAIPPDVEPWIDRARAAGVSFCILSNNFHADSLEVGRHLDMPVVHKALKPLPFGFLSALSRVGGTTKDTVIVGDQFATDILGAHLCGMRAYMVQPLSSSDLPHTVLLRRIEGVFVGSKEPEGGIPEGAEACRSLEKE